MRSCPLPLCTRIRWVPWGIGCCREIARNAGNFHISLNSISGLPPRRVSVSLSAAVSQFLFLFLRLVAVHVLFFWLFFFVRVHIFVYVSGSGWMLEQHSVLDTETVMLLGGSMRAVCRLQRLNPTSAIKIPPATQMSDTHTHTHTRTHIHIHTHTHTHTHTHSHIHTNTKIPHTHEAKIPAHLHTYTIVHIYNISHTNVITY